MHTLYCHDVAVIDKARRYLMQSFSPRFGNCISAATDSGYVLISVTPVRCNWERKPFDLGKAPPMGLKRCLVWRSKVMPHERQPVRNSFAYCKLRKLSADLGERWVI